MMMVSVIMITYGHEAYVKKSIEMILQQECDFDFELLIANDCSPDRTDDIIIELLSIHPKAEKVKYFKHDKNLGMMANSLFAMNLASGKYVALCEGDDYWTDKLKLQLQVDFLENNLDYVMCFHAVNVETTQGAEGYVYPLPRKDTLFLKDIIRNHYIPTCSLMYRNFTLENGYPDWMLNSISGDIPLEILLSAHGKTKYMPIKMACYLRNPGGISHSPKQLEKMRLGYIFMYNKLLQELGYVKGYYLIYKIARLIGGGVKNKVLNFFLLTNRI
jgi:glycosyltransferase involved in cell wall biosynthesis